MPADDTQVTQVMLAAVNAAGAIGNRKLWQWQNDVRLMSAEIAMMIRPDRDGRNDDRTRVERLLDEDTHPIITHYGGYDIEDSSKRMIVKMLNEDGTPSLIQRGTDKGKPETIRTDRLDSPGGRLIKQILDDCEIGDKMLMIRCNQQIDGGERTFRLLVHARRLGKSRSGQTGSATTRRQEPPPPPDEPPPPAEPPVRPTDAVESERVKGLRAKARERLSTHQWNEVAQRASQQGIDVMHLSEVDWHEQVAPICRDVVAHVPAEPPAEEEPF